MMERDRDNFFGAIFEGKYREKSYQIRGKDTYLNDSLDRLSKGKKTWNKSFHLTLNFHTFFLCTRKKNWKKYSLCVAIYTRYVLNIKKEEKKTKNNNFFLLLAGTRVNGKY